MKATIVTIGDEILIGQIIDTNSAWIGSQLNEIGIDVAAIISVSDSQQGILRGLKQASVTSELILVTGGLGPTKDDITKRVLAEYLDDKLEFNESNYKVILAMFEQRGLTMTAAHKQQCYLPSTAQLIENKMGTAPGMVFKKEGKTIISMPGVPSEMKYIMTHGVIPMFRDKSDEVIIHKTIRTVGQGETRIAEMIEDLVVGLPSHMKIAYLPSLGQVRLRLTSKGIDRSKLQNDINTYSEKITDLLGDLVYGFDNTLLEEALRDLAADKKVMISLAESCTGGHISHKITSVSGSSRYFAGSVISYSNDLKQGILKVPDLTLESHGAVSEETVLAMLHGVLDLTKTDLGAAISGVAGPTGGTPDKPVGTVWIAIGSKDKQITKKLLISKDRLRNIEYSTTVVLNLLRKFIMANI